MNRAARGVQQDARATASSCADAVVQPARGAVYDRALTHRGITVSLTTHGLHDQRVHPGGATKELELAAAPVARLACPIREEGGADSKMYNQNTSQWTHEN